MNRYIFIAFLFVSICGQADEPAVTVQETVPPGGTIEISLDLPSDAKPLEMVHIPAGTFTMGSPADVRGRSSTEWLPHQVTLQNDFYIGKYEVTQAQYEAVMGENPSFEYGVGANYPVYEVSWYDCAWYCNRLSEMEGLIPVFNETDWSVNWNANGYRLPTEAEWEYACRAGTQTRFSFGDGLEIADEGEVYSELGDQYMWWKGNNEYGEYVFGPKEVGLKLPNDWGLYDMHGNIEELCMDWWEEPWDRGAVIDPHGPESGSDHVTKSSRWWEDARFLKSSNRWHRSPNERNGSLGFRLLRKYEEAASVNHFSLYQ